jgi:hypothetical protein
MMIDDWLLLHAEDHLMARGRVPLPYSILICKFSLLDFMPVSRNLSFSDQRDPLFFHPSARTLTLGRVAPFAYIPSDPSRVYQNPAMKLIFLCRYFGQIHERNIYSSIEFRK